MSPPHNPATLEAERILLRDKMGRVRIELSAAKDYPLVRLFDDQAHARIELALATDGAAGFQLLDDAGTARIVVALDVDAPHTSTPTISLNGRAGEGSIVIYVSPDGVNKIAFYNKERRLTFSIPPIP